MVYIYIYKVYHGTRKWSPGMGDSSFGKHHFLGDPFPFNWGVDLPNFGSHQNLKFDDLLYQIWRAVFFSRFLLSDWMILPVFFFFCHGYPNLQTQVSTIDNKYQWQEPSITITSWYQYPKTIISHQKFQVPKIEESSPIQAVWIRLRETPPPK